MIRPTTPHSQRKPIAPRKEASPPGGSVERDDPLTTPPAATTMAFLCPVRVRKGRRKRVKEEAPIPGRITGSASIDTLVRVGLEKEQLETEGIKPDTKMVAMHNFTPCVDDEVEVKQGEHIHVLYQENDWVYIITEDNREGFIPYTYCTTLENYQSASTPPPTHTNNNDRPYSLSPLQESQENSDPESQRYLTFGELDVPGSVQHFKKQSCGRYIVLFDFSAQDENDISVQRGEFVTVLNQEDESWFWIIKTDDQEGFVPSAFICPAEGQPLENVPMVAPLSVKQQQSMTNEELQARGTELISLYDYTAQAPDDLTVSRGEWLYTDLTNQLHEGWIWVYSPAARRQGYIPRAYAKPPNMTAL